MTDKNGNGDVNPYKVRAANLPAPPPTRHVLRPASEYIETDDEDRLHIPKDMIPNGFDLQWVTNRIYGQPQPQNRARFERKGWNPVHQSDFDGIFRGMFIGQLDEGEIEVDGLVLMARPMVFTERARELDRKRAAERVYAKEAQLRSGQMPGVTMDTQHESLRGVNRANRFVEPIRVPDE